MDVQFPENVVNKILQITLETQRFAYLSIDAQGVLLSQGGDVMAMGMPSWSPGDNILDDALFLSGLIPMISSHEHISSYQVSDTIIIDVHLFDDTDCTWIILVDMTSQLEWEAQARQKGNELRLLQQKLGNHSNSNKLIESNDDNQFEFFPALNMMALRMLDGGAFKILKPVPNAFSSVYAEAFNSSGPLYPQKKFLFIENFLVDAQEVWSEGDNDKRKRSGPWIEQSENGEEIALEAIAINWDGHKLLFIEIQSEHYTLNHEFLQIGREEVLLNNFLEEEVRKRTKEIRAREEEIALRLVCAADTKDEGETGSHIRRLGLYSELMAKNLGWSKALTEEIRIAAPMHDIGKIGIPDHILKKPGKLTQDEFEIMKLHSEIGGKILSNSKSELIQMACDISLSHHEKWDGSGYPRGLSGEDIPISGRLVAIADVFDALVNKRIYKDKMTIEEALQLMQEGKGKHFDPQLLDLFISLKDEVTQIAYDYMNPISGKNDQNELPGDVHAVGRSD